MNQQLKKFETLLPPLWSSLQQLLCSQGLVMTFVGGVVRDFFRTQELGVDWDIELTHPTLSFSKEMWKGVGKSLSGLGHVTYLPYEVIRLEAQGYQVEFSPPRQEIFQDHLAHEGHKNFEAHFDFKLPFDKAVLRRDFTINAMGLSWLGSKFELLDPLNGLRHLREALLYPAGSDFIQDPVRFLRAFRFARRFEFSLAPELQQLMDKMNLRGLSPYYLWKELQKSSDALEMYHDLLRHKAAHPELRLPVGEELLIHWENFKRMLPEPKSHEAWMVALEWVGIKSEDWAQYFSLSADLPKKFGRWARDSQAFLKMYPEAFHGEFEDIRQIAAFNQLFEWFYATKHLVQKYPQVPLLQMIEEHLPHWIHLYRFELLKDVRHVDPPWRAKYQLWNLCQRL